VPRRSDAPTELLEPLDKERVPLVSAIRPALKNDPSSGSWGKGDVVEAPVSTPSPVSQQIWLHGTWFTRGKKLARNVLRGLYKHRALDHAAAMAFYFFLGIIPLLVSCGMIVGQLVRTEGSEAFLAPLYRIMPSIAADLVRGELVDIAAASSTMSSVAPFTLLAFLWLTSNGFHNLMDIFETLAVAQRRSWWQKRFIAIAWVLMILIGVTVATWILLKGSGILAALGAGATAERLPRVLRNAREWLEEGWQAQGVVLLFTMMSFFGLAAFYRIAIVHPPQVKRHVWSGTVVAFILWSLASWGFSAYVKTLANYALYYGGVATMATTLLWLYLTSLALVIGAEVNAQLEGIRSRPMHPGRGTPRKER